MRPDAPTRPYLKPWYRIVPDGNRLLLEYGQRVTVLEGRAVGRLLPELLPLLDGTRRIDDLEAALGEPARPAVRNAVRLLAERGLVTEGPPLEGFPRARDTVAFLAATSHEGSSPAEVQAALGRARVGVLGDGVGAVEVARLLRLSGVTAVSEAPWSEPAEPDEHDLVVVAPASVEVPRLPEWNAATLATPVAWLLVLPFDGRMAAIGPLILPRETCCYECFRLRSGANVDWRAERPTLDASPATQLAPPSLTAAVAGLAATVALRWVASRDRLLPGTFQTLELAPRPRLELHRVLRVPRCPACSTALAAAPLPWFRHGDADAA